MREGWQYNLGDSRIFIEDIDGFKPSIEIVSETEQEIQDLLNKIGIMEIIKESVPEVMRKILMK